MKNINERENDGQNRYVRISILDNDVCMILKQNENDEVSKRQKCNKFYPSQHDVAPVYGFFKCQEKSVNSYLVTTFYTEVKGN